MKKKIIQFSKKMKRNILGSLVAFLSAVVALVWLRAVIPHVALINHDRMRQKLWIDDAKNTSIA